jgi:hypothetical protein
MKMLEKRLVRIFEPRRDKIIGWRKFHNEELYNLLLARYHTKIC